MNMKVLDCVMVELECCLEGYGLLGGMVNA